MNEKSEFVIFQGDSMIGRLSLVLRSGENKTPYAIPEGATVAIHFPGLDATTPVILSTANTNQVTEEPEVSVTNAATGNLTFNGAPSKSPLLNAGSRQAIDVIVTDTQGSVKTFEKRRCLDVLTRENS